MEDEVVVRIRRRVLQRLTCDAVVHWVARSASPSCGAMGRSLDGVERTFRRKMAALPGWDADRANAARIVFELAEAGAEMQNALEARTRAIEEARRAADAASVAIRSAIRAFLVGTPAFSVRDAARILGVSRTLVQRVAKDCATRDGAKRSRAMERSAALDARRMGHPAYLARRAAQERRMAGEKPVILPG